MFSSIVSHFNRAWSEGAVLIFTKGEKRLSDRGLLKLRIMIIMSFIIQIAMIQASSIPLNSQLNK